jgi:hypothetical protein
MSLKTTKYLINLIGIILMIWFSVREYHNLTKLVDCCPVYDMKDAQKESLFPVFCVYMFLVIIGNLFAGKISGEKWKREFAIIVLAQLIILVFIVLFQIEYIKYSYLK